ncbi:Ribosomal protein L11 methyltransferase [Trichinella pseudospiralis]
MWSVVCSWCLALITIICMKTKPDRKFDLNTNDRTLEIGAQVSPRRKSHPNDENFTRQLVQSTKQYICNCF